MFRSPPSAAQDAELEAGLAKSKLPEAKDRDPLLDYDCILLGDVSLRTAARRSASTGNYVSERGGTLVMIAGKRHLPMAYATMADEPFAKMLPVESPTELKNEMGFLLRATSEGKSQPFLQLDPQAPVFAWPELPKHYWGIVGKRKPAATILLAPAADDKTKATTDEFGIVAQHSYGLGRVLFVGIDSTWRWRFRVGDPYHHRFWGQVARWAAAEKLLPAGNRHVRYVAEPVYVRDEVEVAARLNAPRLE